MNSKLLILLCASVMITMGAMSAMPSQIPSHRGGATATSPSVTLVAPVFSLTAQYKAINTSITNQSTSTSGTINYIVHYSTSSTVTNATQNVSTANGRDWIELGSLTPGTVYYFAVDAENMTAPITHSSFGPLSAVQSTSPLGIFSFSVGLVKIHKVTKGNKSGDWNITIPIATLSGAGFNSMQLYYDLSNVSSSTLLSSSPFLASYSTITKTSSNWTFNDVVLPIGTVFLYGAFNFSASAGPYKGLGITQIGSPGKTLTTGKQPVGIFIFGTNGALAIVTSPLGTLVIVVIVALVIYVVFKGGEHEEKKK